jgi:hypothetical protein
MFIRKLTFAIGLGVLASAALACGGGSRASGRVPAISFKAPASDDVSPCRVGASARVSDVSASVAVGLRVVVADGVQTIAFTSTAVAPHASSDPLAFHRESAAAPMKVARPGGTVLVWTEQSGDDGYVVRARAADVDGMPVGEPFTVSPSTFPAAGRPVASILEDGTGIIGYFSDDGTAFHAVATRLSCRVM